MITDYEHSLILLGALQSKLQDRQKVDAASGIITDHTEKVLYERMQEFLTTPRIYRRMREALEKWESMDNTQRGQA